MSLRLFNASTKQWTLIARITEVMPGIQSYLETDPETKTAYLEHEEAILHQLEKWIHNYPEAYLKTEVGTVDTRKPPGKKIQARAYLGHGHLVKGLIAWVKAKPNRQLEKSIADIVLGHINIQGLLALLLKRVWLKVSLLDKPLKEMIRAEWKTGKIEQGKDRGKSWGAYQTYFRRDPPFWGMLDPTALKAPRQIELVHDLMEYFSGADITKHATAGAGMLIRTSGELSYVATVFDPASGLVRKVVGKDERSKKGKYASADAPNMKWLEHVSTRDPENLLTMTADMHSMPVWAGNSQTTARMLDFCQWLGATPLELEAVAWCIFAYWRLVYDKAATAYHTFHEVMDVAANYGVQYEPFSYTAPLLMGLDPEQIAVPLHPPLPRSKL